MRTYLFLAMGVLLSIPLQAQLMLEGQFRTRAELRNGYKQLASDATYANLQVGQRSRLALSYSDTAYSFRFAMQDARVWGQNWNAMPSNTIHLYEAWAAYRITPSLQLKVGRQELKYDDQRILAIKNFSLTGATYDAALLMYTSQDKAFNLHWGSMINNTAEANFLSGYPMSFKYMSYLWLARKASDLFHFNSLFMADLTQNAADAQIMYGRNTLGANVLVNSAGPIGGRVGGYYQFGSTWMSLTGIGEQSRRVSAYSYNATLWYKPAAMLQLSLAIDAYSGHDWAKDPTIFTAFNRMLAAGHAHLGFIDYFTSADLREVKWAGLNDLLLRAEYRPSPKLTLQATGHLFWLDKPYLPVAPLPGFMEVDRTLGSEVDLIASLTVSKGLSIQAAFMTILPSETLEILKLGASSESSFSHFSYVSMLFTPTFFKGEQR